MGRPDNHMCRVTLGAWNPSVISGNVKSKKKKKGVTLSPAPTHLQPTTRSGREGDFGKVGLTVTREHIAKEEAGQTDRWWPRENSKSAEHCPRGNGREERIPGPHLGRLLDAPGYMMRSSCVTWSLCSAVLEPFMICKACYSFREHFAKLLASHKGQSRVRKYRFCSYPRAMAAFCSPSLCWSGNSSSKIRPASFNIKQSTKNHCVAKVRTVSWNLFIYLFILSWTVRCFLAAGVVEGVWETAFENYLTMHSRSRV